MELQSIYLGKITEAVARITACNDFLSQYTSSRSLAALEAAVLQARKALESVAYASIAPNKSAYEHFRTQAEKPADFRKDYNARKIFQLLSQVNPDFYPTALLPPTKQSPGHWHFDKKTIGVLTKSRFETFYDRLGKFLHADNPWDSDKGLANLLADLPVAMSELRELLVLHKTVVRTPSFSGVWVLEVPISGTPPQFFTAQASGEFLVT